MLEAGVLARNDIPARDTGLAAPRSEIDDRVAEAILEFTTALEREREQQQQLVGGTDRAGDAARPAGKTPGALEPTLPGPQMSASEPDVSGRGASKRDTGSSRGR